jgi:murein DD-endopeptidase MepM/ murein hydrolase activator NlpD
MSTRPVGERLKSTGAIATVIGLGIALSACTTFGSASAPDVTASTGPQLSAQLDQPMPAALTPAPSGGYIPGADVGVAPTDTQDPLVGRTVARDSLPPLSSDPVTSTQPMSVQSSVAAVEAAPTPAPAQAGVFYHTVASGESLYSIARRYSVTVQTLVDANGLESADKIFVGQRLGIPGRTDLAPSAPAAPTVAATPTPDVVAEPAAAPVTTASTAPAPTITPAQPAQITATPNASGADKYRWPAQGRLIADFRASRGTGINIELPEGTAIHAVENGTVIYTGDTVEGYGNLVLIRHAGGFVSAYAHLKDISVTKGQVINRGDIIGSAGMTGSVTRPQLHFELRQGATPVDPVPLLAG